MRWMLVLLAACTNTAAEGIESWPLTAPGSCVVAGAFPDDGLDDRAAIQAALDTQGCADLSSGTYDVAVEYPRRADLDRFDLLKLRGGRTLRGAGPATVIRFYGDAHGSDVRGVGMTGDANAVTALTLDTTGFTGTSEQTHAIHVLGPAAHQSVTSVWFKHPRPQERSASGGDCIKVVGYDPDRRVSLTVTNNVFAVCDRSGIAVHGGVRGAAFSGNLFLDTGDQDIDLEGNAAVEDLIISGNVIRRSNAGTSIAIGASRSSRVAITGNTIGGPLNAYNAQQLTISGNAIVGGIELVKATGDVAITGNVINGAITASHHNSGKPGGITIANNQVRVDGVAASIISASDVVIVGNSFRTDAATGPALVIYGITQPTETILVSGNVFRGPWTRALQTTNSYFAGGGGVAAISFIGNVMRGPTFGLVCNQPGPGPFVVTGNSGAPSSCSAPLSAGQ